MIRRPASRAPDSPVTRSPIPAEYERLHALYEISSALARSPSVTHACAAALAIVRRVVPITAAVLLDATAEMPVTWTWASEDAAPGALERARDRARATLAYLAPRGEGTLDQLGDVPRDRYVITLPLMTSEVCGVFQIERSEPFEERDLLFIDAVVDQLAITCDRHHARTLLEAAHDTALAAIRSRDAILGTVSHDLLAPLSRIHAWAEVLRSDESDTDHGLDVILESVAQMVRMVGDLLDTSSIEAGYLSVSLSAERASALVADAVEDIRAAAALKQVRLETRLPARDLLVECDRLRILQVLTNLLSNAVKFTPARGTITAVLVEEDGRARFSVEDTGSGISPADLAHVFDRHWQATRTLQRGSGLGLSIAKGIVESHGGSLMVESQVGRGTTFSFALPLARRDD